MIRPPRQEFDVPVEGAFFRFRFFRVKWGAERVYSAGYEITRVMYVEPVATQMWGCQGRFSTSGEMSTATISTKRSQAVPMFNADPTQ